MEAQVAHRGGELIRLYAKAIERKVLANDEIKAQTM